MCEWCGEEGVFFFRFAITSPKGSFEEGIACADCIATWFKETPEDVRTMTINLEG